MTIAELNEARDLLTRFPAQQVALMLDRDPSHMRKIRAGKIHRVAA